MWPVAAVELIYAGRSDAVNAFLHFYFKTPSKPAEFRGLRARSRLAAIALLDMETAATPSNQRRRIAREPGPQRRDLAFGQPDSRADGAMGRDLPRDSHPRPGRLRAVRDDRR